MYKEAGISNTHTHTAKNKVISLLEPQWLRMHVVTVHPCCAMYMVCWGFCFALPLGQRPKDTARSEHKPNHTSSRKSKLAKIYVNKGSAGGAAATNATHPEVVRSAATVPAHQTRRINRC